MNIKEFEEQFKKRLLEITEISEIGGTDLARVNIILSDTLPIELYGLAMLAKGHKINLNHLFGID